MLQYDYYFKIINLKKKPLKAEDDLFELKVDKGGDYGSKSLLFLG